MLVPKTKMNNRKRIFSFAVIFSFIWMIPQAYSEPEVSISMDKTTYSYCEYLFYTIEVSEITGNPAIIHIRDEVGKGSSAIPIGINALQTPVPSIVPFEAEIFPLGKYFIDVEYSGSTHTAEFHLVESDNICFPQVVKLFVSEWLNGNMPDGFLVDAFQKHVDPQLLEIPFETNEDNKSEIKIPTWVKNPAFWWIQGGISDNEFAEIINYLIEEKIIDFKKNSGPEI